ncbi:MAG: hypothetical protein B9S32_00060 [Verrucomicrobia bacterium Tous-C9LFEB]|nr:MAG: hypothetical protein B9S32_00060 [Verrucomicrobia bacterium Tous-C9LFEB]
MNDTQSIIIQLLREHGAMTHQQLSRRLGLSLMGINKCFATLKQAGLIEFVKSAQFGPGRPASSACLAPDAGYALGVSIKHLEVELALVNLQNKVLDFTRVPVAFWGEKKKSSDFVPLFAAINKMLKAVPPGKLRGIGMSISGTFDLDTGVITVANDFESVEQANAFRLQLERKYRAAVWLVHDTETGLISERWCNPSFPPRPTLLYVRDRLGFSLMLQGKLFRGSNVWMAWLGRVQAPQTPREAPGLLPGALAFSARVESWNDRLHGFAPGTRTAPSAEVERAEIEELFKRWDQEDPEVRKIVNRGLHKLALVIRNVCLILPFDRVILNGWTPGILTQAIAETSAVLQEGYVVHGAHVKDSNPPVSAAILGDRTDAVGAALWAFDQQLQTRIAQRGWKKNSSKDEDDEE